MTGEVSGGRQRCGRALSLPLECLIWRAHLQDKLEPSEALGDLLQRAGDHDAALGMYQRANVPSKVIEGLAAKGDFDALSKFRCAHSAHVPPPWQGLPKPSQGVKDSNGGVLGAAPIPSRQGVPT